MDIVHLWKSDDNDDDPNLSFMFCGAFCTYAADASLRPAGFDFVNPPDPRGLTTCALCLQAAGLVTKSRRRQAVKA